MGGWHICFIIALHYTYFLNWLKESERNSQGPTTVIYKCCVLKFHKIIHFINQGSCNPGIWKYICAFLKVRYVNKKFHNDFSGLLFGEWEASMTLCNDSIMLRLWKVSYSWPYPWEGRHDLTSILLILWNCWLLLDLFVTRDLYCSCCCKIQI